MKPKTNTDNVVKFKGKSSFNMGIFVLAIIFLYLLITIGMYLTKPRISVYEVREGAILKDSAYTALAIREEETVYAKDNGYVNFYIQSSSKAKKGSNIYSLSSEELTFSDTVSKEELILTTDQQYALFLELQEFNNHYSRETFKDTYSVKSNIEGMLQDMMNQSRVDIVRTELKNGTLDDTKLYKTKDDGIVSYYTDGLEELTIETVTPAHLNKKEHIKQSFKNNAYISEGDPLYKLITNENWHLYFEISDETHKILESKKYVKIRFKKDNQEVWTALTLRDIDGKHYLLLSLDNSMIRYVDERYIDIDLILEDETGLKIPKTAETTKEFYAVPKAYITQGGNSNKDGVLRRTTDKAGNISAEFFAIDIYYEDEEVVYLDPNVFSPNDVLVKPESQDTFTLSEKRDLKGVYQVNKGYAIFKQINVLCESDEYYIVEEGSSFGLSNYDHIVLDSSQTTENAIVF